MNKKLKILNSLLALCLIVAMMALQAVPVLALEDGNTATPMETATGEPQESPTATGDAEGDNNTTPEESPSEGQETALTASTLEELLQTIDQAEEGTVISFTGMIQLIPDTVLGKPGVNITLQRATTDSGFVVGSSESPFEEPFTVRLWNITFDGNQLQATVPMLTVQQGQTHIGDSAFKNCYTEGGGGAVNMMGGSAFFTTCSFDNNRASLGAHIMFGGGTLLHMEGCNLTNGLSSYNGGAIQVNSTSGVCNLTTTTITGNHAANNGGAIYNGGGTVNITQSKIYGNTADKGASDLWSENGRIQLNDDLETLTGLYSEDGVEAVGWCYDYPADPVDLPFMGGAMPVMLKMTFADNKPAPVPDPTPEPDPEPTPTPTPEPTPSQSTTTHHSSPSTAQTVTPKEIALTNGKAVLKAPEALFWTGYETGRETITRADLAALMVSLMDSDSLKEYSTETASFDDVEDGSPAIGTAQSAGIMVGCGDGAFQPERQLTWGELITVLCRFTDQEEPPAEVYTGDHWAADAVNTAIGLGWITYSETFDPGWPVSCGEAVDLIQTVFQWASD